MEILVSDMIQVNGGDAANLDIEVKFTKKGEGKKRGRPVVFESPPEVHAGLNGFCIAMVPHEGHPDITIEVGKVSTDRFVLNARSIASLSRITWLRFSYIAIGIRA